MFYHEIVLLIVVLIPLYKEKILYLINTIEYYY